MCAQGVGLLREVRAARKPGCPACNPKGDAYADGVLSPVKHTLLLDCRPWCVEGKVGSGGWKSFHSGLTNAECCATAECHCTAGHVAGRSKPDKRGGHAHAKPSPAKGTRREGGAAAAGSTEASGQEQAAKPKRRGLFHRRKKEAPGGDVDAASVQQVGRQLAAW